MSKITEDQINELLKSGQLGEKPMLNRSHVVAVAEKLLGDAQKCICGHQYRHFDNECNCRYCDCTEFRCDSEKTSWKLFLDDERDPVDNTWVICRSIYDVINELCLRGFPDFVSFDHDLGLNQEDSTYDNTGIRTAHYLIDQVLDGRFTLPDNFDWYVHSQNPIGAENINGLLTNFVNTFKKV
jgi:hypothetical protein